HEKDLQLYDMWRHALLADANVIRQDGEIKETTQHVVDERAAKQKISQFLVIAHCQRHQKRHRARSREQPRQIEKDRDCGGKYADLNYSVRQRVERKKVIQRQIIQRNGGPLRI